MHGAHDAVTTRIPAPDLRQWVETVFMRINVPQEDAVIAAHVLIDADLRGKPTHGVSRLPLYVGRIERGLIAPRPEIHFESPKTPTMVRMDGGNGLGPVVAWRATERATQGAQRYGIAAVAVRHSNHCGAMHAYCLQAASQGLILLALTNSPPGIAPWGGRRPFLGTNPIAWGFPRGSHQAPLLIDLATSVVARGNIIQAARLNLPIPLGWAIDSDGNPTSDAERALEGAVLPMAGAKGYALALAVEILSGLLSGAGMGPEVKNPYTDNAHASNVGHFFLAIDPETLMPKAEFADRLNGLEQALRAVPAAADGPVFVPGDHSEMQFNKNLEYGVPLDLHLIDELNALADRLDMPELRP